MTNDSIAKSFDAWLKDPLTHWVGEQDAAYQAWLHVHETVVEGLEADNERLRATKNTIECRFEVSEDTLKTIRGCLSLAESDIDALKAECEGLRKDAERYRFVIDCPIRTMVALGRKAHETDFDLSAECDRLMKRGGHSND